MWIWEPLQTREALEAILKDLHEEDHFALILFDNNIITWKDSLTKATEENVSEAIAYIRKLRDNGCKGTTRGTNLYDKCFCPYSEYPNIYMLHFVKQESSESDDFNLYVKCLFFQKTANVDVADE